MPPSPTRLWRRLPLAFPPRGAVLVVLCGVYLLAGLIGHDPWKSDDATHFGVVYSLLNGGPWLLPRLAGEPWLDNPPVFYWIAALLARIFGLFLPLHDAARLAAGLFGALTLGFLAATARLTGNRDSPVAATLVAIGCLGLLVHGHDLQPAMALLAAIAATHYGLHLLREQPVPGGSVTGFALALAFACSGLPALLGLGPLLFLLPLISRHWRTAAALRGLVLALILALAAASSWPVALGLDNPAGLTQWWARELSDLRVVARWPMALIDFLVMLGWFAWPALPLALWALWRGRKRLGEPATLLPLLSFGLLFFLQSLLFDARSLNALPLLPPLILLAVPATASLRRGAANAFDWFGMMTLTLVAGLIWLGWVAMITGVPTRIAGNFAKIEPGFVAQFAWLPFLVALLLSLGWLWLIFSSPRSPLRGTAHWAAGVTLIWCLLIALWLPWIDYGKSYRAVAASLKAALPANAVCIAGRDLGDAQRSSFHYFAGILTRQESAEAVARCDLFLIQGMARTEDLPPGTGWRRIWEGNRRGDRVERFRLYQKE